MPLGGYKRVDLPNGYAVSITRKDGTYCNGGTAETAIFDPEGGFLPHKGDNVQGWQNLSEIEATIAYAASLRTTAEARRARLLLEFKGKGR